MDEYFLRRNLDFIRAGFYAQGSSKDFSEGAGRVLGETPDTRKRLSGIEGGGGNPVTSYGPFSTLLRTIFHFTTDETPLPIISPG